MKKIMKMFLWATLLLFASNCSDNQPIWPVDNLGARLVAYDEDAIEKTSFEANSNIGFGLSLLNKSDLDIDAGGHYDYCYLYQMEEFLLIYKLIREDNGEETWMPYGKPYEEPAPCPSINIPLIVPVGEQRIVQGRLWNSIPHNAPFTAGKYYTALSFDLELGGMSRRHDLKLEFEVY